MKICPHCQTRLAEDELFCSQCGKKYEAPTPPPPPVQQPKPAKAPKIAKKEKTDLHTESQSVPYNPFREEQMAQAAKAKKDKRFRTLMLVFLAVVLMLMFALGTLLAFILTDNGETPSRKDDYRDSEDTDSTGEDSRVLEDSSSSASSDSISEETTGEISYESSDVPSEDPASEKNPNAKPTNGENVAAGKTYEISEQFRAGGADVGWGYDENAPISYPDNGNDLTDGYIPTNDDAYSADCWMAFHQYTPAQTERGYGFVKMDLGEIYEISEISITSLKHIAAGFTCPYNIEFMVSEDGETYVSAGILDITGELDGLADDSVHTLTAELDCTARYLEIRVISYGWAFMGEIEIK